MKKNKSLITRQNFCSRGFSLLELLIYIAILLFLLIIIIDSFGSIFKAKNQVEAKSEVNSNIRFVVEKIAQDLKTASSVSVPVLGTNASTLSITVSGNTVLFDVSAGVMRRKVNSGTAEPVTSPLVTVDTPVFIRLENYNSVLQATTTSIQTVITVRYSGTSPDQIFSGTINNTTTLR